MEKTVGGVSSAVESSLLQSVYTILRELDTDIQASSACNKGMLRWTLHKKVENNPSTTISLLRVLVKELEKADRMDSKIRIIPLLHTLIYTVLQCVYVPDDLYERVYVCLKRLVTLPEPYCSIGLNYAKLMKMEHKIPGALYQRRIIAEHSLKNEHYPFNERVFVFVDPAVLPQTLLDAVRADVECDASDWDTERYQRSILLHTLQAGLGKQCHGQKLAEALEHLDEDMERYFQDVVAAVEETVCPEDGGTNCDQYSTRLAQIYRKILSHAGKDRSPSFLVGTTLPSPEISFHVWTKEDEIWNKMVNFALMLSPAERSSVFLPDNDDDTKRASVFSTISVDSGIEGDLPLNEFSFLTVDPPGGLEVQDQRKSSYFTRRPCARWPKAGNRMTLMMEGIRGSGGPGGSGNSLPKEEKNLTARIVVMGDDSTLGRLARAYFNIRKRETRHLFLTKRINMETYYIPVTSQPVATSPAQEDSPGIVDMLTIAGFLDRVDPWYDCNITSLGAKILKLAEMHSSVSGTSKPSSFLLDIISYYTRTAQQPIHIPIYFVKMTFSGLKMKPVEDVFVCQLDMDIPKFRPPKAKFRDTIKGSVRHSKITQEDVGIVVSINYRQASISNREADRVMSTSIYGVLICAALSHKTKSPDSLIIDFRDPNPTRSPLVRSTLRVTSICIRALEEKTFTVCLDKDSRRCFKNVQSIEVSTCTDPGYCLQKNSKSGQREEEQSSGLSRYLNKNFSLPINTFSGIVQ